MKSLYAIGFQRPEMFSQWIFQESVPGLITSTDQPTDQSGGGVPGLVTTLPSGTPTPGAAPAAAPSSGGGFWNAVGTGLTDAAKIVTSKITSKTLPPGVVAPAQPNYVVPILVGLGGLAVIVTVGMVLSRK